MMNQLTVAEAEGSFRLLLSKVEAGESFVITDEGRPVAELTPAPSARLSFAELTSRMEELRRGSRRRPSNGK